VRQNAILVAGVQREAKQQHGGDPPSDLLAGIAGVFLLACLSPGPVWVVVTSTSVAVSRRAGILAGLGVAGATLTWATVGVLGAGVLLAGLAPLATALRLAGAAYLAWIGLRMIVKAHNPAPLPGSLSAAAGGGWAALRRGYLASITNPKAAVFFGSIFVAVLPTHAPGWVYGTAVVLLALLSAAWHCGLALVFSIAPIQASYRRAKARVDTVVGALLVALGARLALAR